MTKRVQSMPVGIDVDVAQNNLSANTIGDLTISVEVKDNEKVTTLLVKFDFSGAVIKKTILKA